MDGQGWVSILSWSHVPYRGNCGRLADANREVFWASGACFHSQVWWLEANGFDGSLFAHMEEIDLCWRLKTGGTAWGVPAPCQSSTWEVGPFRPQPVQTYLNFRNNLIVMLKNRPGCWPAFMFRRMTLDGIAAWRMLAGGEGANLAVGKAHGAFPSSPSDVEGEEVPQGRSFEALQRRGVASQRGVGSFCQGPYQGSRPRPARTGLNRRQGPGARGSTFVEAVR